jgi:hypothetical protein
MNVRFNITLRTTSWSKTFFLKFGLENLLQNHRENRSIKGPLKVIISVNGVGPLLIFFTILLKLVPGTKTA